MTIAILAGGLAVRMGGLTRKIPKCMLPISGEPFLAHQLRLLSSAGISRVHMCLGHLSEVVVDYLEDNPVPGVEMSWSVESDRLMGTGGALLLAGEYLGEEFGVLYGDSYLPVDYGAAAEQFKNSGKPGMMTVWHNGNAYDRSNLKVQDGMVSHYSADRDDPNQYEWIDYGLSFLRREALEKYDTGSPVQLPAIWCDLVSRGDLSAYEVDSRFYEIGSLGGYEELCRMARSGGMPGVGTGKEGES